MIGTAAPGGSPGGAPPPMGMPPGAPAAAPAAPAMGAPPGARPGAPAAAPTKPGAPPAQATSGAKASERIDPAQIPRASSKPLFGATQYATRTVSGVTSPPAANTEFVVQDAGNCSPRYMRATLNQWPERFELMSMCSMPLGLIVQPMASPAQGEEGVAVVDMGEMGPLRCLRCKAYVNPHFRFNEQGRRYTCNFCGASGDVPQQYACALGADGRRLDAHERPELCRGSVDFVAPDAYMVRPPMDPVFFFLLDASAASVTSGAFENACRSIKQLLGSVPHPGRTKVGFATYDRAINFYSLKPGQTQPAMMVVPDIANVYAPCPKYLLGVVDECKEMLEGLLDSLPAMHRDYPPREAAMGSAVKGALEALKPTGGRLFVLASSAPTVGVGVLKDRQAGANSETVHKLAAPADPTYFRMGQACAEYQVCVDLFLTPQGYMDLASLTPLARETGGDVQLYTPYNPALDSPKLFNDLRWAIVRPTALEGVLRVRTSQGLTVTDHYGHFCQRSATDLDVPQMDCDKALYVSVKHEERLPSGAEAAFQCALLYTTTEGQRRIRVHTLSLPVTEVLGNLYRGADLETQTAFMIKDAARSVGSKPFKTLREKCVERTVEILFAYRKFCASSSSSGQLILPEALKLSPLYTLGLIKSPGLRGSEVLADERAAWLVRALTGGAATVAPLVYPCLYALHTVGPAAEENGLPADIPLPNPSTLSSEHLVPGGFFLIEDGQSAYLWLGAQADPAAINDVLGAPPGQVDPQQFSLQRLGGPWSEAVNRAVNEVRRRRCNYLRLRLVRRGDALERAVFSMLVDDRSGSGMSYVEWLCSLHRSIVSCAPRSRGVGRASERACPSSEPLLTNAMRSAFQFPPPQIAKYS